MTETGTATRSCRTRKRAFYFYKSGVAAARHVRALQCGLAAAAAAAATVSQCTDYTLIISC